MKLEWLIACQRVTEQVPGYPTLQNVLSSPGHYPRAALPLVLDIAFAFRCSGPAGERTPYSVSLIAPGGAVVGLHRGTAVMPPDRDYRLASFTQLVTITEFGRYRVEWQWPGENGLEGTVFDIIESP